MVNRRNKIELSPRLKLSVGRSFSQNNLFKYTALICMIITIGLGINAFRIIFTRPEPIELKNLNQSQVLGVTDDKREIQSGEFLTYTVQKTDTLFNLSQKFNISWTTIATLNNLKSPFILKPGQKLKIPKN